MKVKNGDPLQPIGQYATVYNHPRPLDNLLEPTVIVFILALDQQTASENLCIGQPSLFLNPE